MYSYILCFHQCALSIGTWRVQWHACMGLHVMMLRLTWGRQARMKSEYGVDTTLDPLPYSLARHAFQSLHVSVHNFAHNVIIRETHCLTERHIV